MTIATNPIVRGILTFVGFGLLGSAAIPQLAPFSTYLVTAGSSLLAALHVNLPSVKT